MDSSCVAVAGFKNDYFRRLRCNHSISRGNRYLMFDVAKSGDWLDDFSQVGRGRVTDFFYCGKATTFSVCFADHDGIEFNGVRYSVDDVVAKHGHIWCNKRECPTCFQDGWGLRTALAVWAKLSVGVALYGQHLEHAEVSFPSAVVDSVFKQFGSWRGYEVLRKMSIEACVRRGIVGAVLIPHARRLNRREQSLVKGFHSHLVGIVEGSYEICRSCEFLRVSKRRSWCSCEGECKGFEQRTRRANRVDGAIVRVFGRRAAGSSEEEAVIRTVRYLLSHASFLDSSVRRFYVVSYFGCFANKRCKAVKVSRPNECSVCKDGTRDGVRVGVHSVMVPAQYRGVEEIASRVGDCCYERVFRFPKRGADGRLNFVPRGGRVDGG